MKNIIIEEVFCKYFDGDLHIIRFSDLPNDIQENDIIDIHRIEPYYSENQSNGAYTQLVINREREETDDEYQKRISKEEKQKNELKQRRYETYLKLKSEFENNLIN
jgi:hypothetical protein